MLNIPLFILLLSLAVLILWFFVTRTGAGRMLSDIIISNISDFKAGAVESPAEKGFDSELKTVEGILLRLFPDYATNLSREYTSLRQMAKKIAMGRVQGRPVLIVTENRFVVSHQNELKDALSTPTCTIDISTFAERRYGFDIMGDM